eukprot:CAMPEP_0169434716 /NCGR_PEP_ID=MMETSP1042-20121227/4682_1 /TAXON_ID=464988 /ORGANISM="Hemiselmis andersenii, Strain CCMP1180" /LENGTH=176 /DNA_ID=CAMNT_0009545319 /DNA_START=34 /DNA_END=561 /DNA_ORIENTATION=+
MVMEDHNAMEGWVGVVSPSVTHLSKLRRRLQRQTTTVRRACKSCRDSKAKCDDQRPCSRCVTGGRQDSCVDSETQSRKKRPPEDASPNRRREPLEGSHQAQQPQLQPQVPWWECQSEEQWAAAFLSTQHPTADPQSAWVDAASRPPPSFGVHPLQSSAPSDSSRPSSFSMHPLQAY